jgi:hypothetical protein
MNVLKNIETNFKMLYSHGRIMPFHSSHSMCHGTFHPDCEMWSLWAPEGLSVDSGEKISNKNMKKNKNWMKYCNTFSCENHLKTSSH